jgi:NO-binding membrane sensor protein with MHYT domain
MGMRRLLLLNGIALILVGMLFGDIFAVFVLHQNASRVGASLASAAHAALAGDSAAVASSFQNVGAFLENRGTKVDTHVHMIGFGYLALLLAVIEPWIALSATAKRRIAWLFLFGSWLLPIGVFLIHYVGLAGSPFSAIGWASVAADLGGLLVIVALLGCFIGIWKYFRSGGRDSRRDELMASCVAGTRLLLVGGVLLVLLGFLGGAAYAAFDLYQHEAQDFSNLSDMARGAASGNAATVDRALNDYGQLQGDKAVNIAAHAHAIEFGILAMLLGLFQPFVALAEKWRRRWAAILLLGSLMLPVCVYFELRYGLLAGGFADLGGLLVILALFAMWVGIFRCTGQLDASTTEMPTEVLS